MTTQAFKVPGVEIMAVAQSHIHLLPIELCRGAHSGYQMQHVPATNNFCATSYECGQDTVKNSTIK